jgi:hypothetical protein
MKFPLGQLVITRGALEVLDQEDVQSAVSRHVNGDWGEVDPEDWKENDFSVENGFRILSAYTSKKGVKFWIITEADRSATTILLPKEY